MLVRADAPGKEGAYSTCGGGRGYRGHTLRTDRYRIVRWTNARGEVGLVELYDHRTDPDENTNIAGRHPDLVRMLTQQLEQKIKQVVQTSHQAD
jgi:hypothetical protein